MQWVGLVAFIGLGVLILIATVPRRRADAPDEPTEEVPMGDGSEPEPQ